MATPNKEWSTFSVTKNAVTLKFRAVEPPLERVDEIVELLFNYFVKEEALYKAAEVSKSEEAAAEFRQGITSILKSGLYHIVVCCLDNDNNDIGEIIAVSYMCLADKDAPSDGKPSVTTKALQKMFSMYFAIEDMYDLKKELKIDQYYDDRGLVVHPKYRGYGIAQELIKVRRLVCKEQGVPATSALMTAYGTQKAAERDGWETLFELNLADFGKQHGVTFEDCPPTAKLMFARI